MEIIWVQIVCVFAANSKWAHIRTAHQIWAVLHLMRGAGAAAVLRCGFIDLLYRVGRGARLPAEYQPKLPKAANNNNDIIERKNSSRITYWIYVYVGHDGQNTIALDRSSYIYIAEADGGIKYRVLAVVSFPVFFCRCIYPPIYAGEPETAFEPALSWTCAFISTVNDQNRFRVVSLLKMSCTQQQPQKKITKEDMWRKTRAQSRSAKHSHIPHHVKNMVHARRIRSHRYMRVESNRK